MCIRDRSTSLTQMQRNQVVDTYEAVWLGVEENDIETLKGVPEFERVGGYYMLGAVSYTHLDVYKRQAMRWARWTTSQSPL